MSELKFYIMQKRPTEVRHFTGSTFISRILSVYDVGIIYLGCGLLHTSSSVPDAFCGTGRSNASVSPCSRWGLPSHRHYCRCWCAFTTPFHPHTHCWMQSLLCCTCRQVTSPGRYPASLPYGVRTFLDKHMTYRDSLGQPGRTIIQGFVSYRQVQGSGFA